MRPVLIPVERYVSDGFAARERTQLWPAVWQLACSLDHVAQPGDWYEHVVGTLSVLVVRGDDGELRAFQNVCRHRGSALCTGTGGGLSELRCPYHGWTWDLHGRLREVPSRRVFGVGNDEYGLFPVRVDTWGPLVFVNVSHEGPGLAEFLEPVAHDCAWARIDEFRCTARATVAARCNWKTLIEGFSETYHVQGIHREMLAMADDVRGPQHIWGWHGKLQQSYGLASPRTQGVSDAQVWAGFIEVMGTRIGIPTDTPPDAAPPPEVPAGGTMRAVIADRVRAHAAATGHDYSGLDDSQVLDMSQYNLFPNVSVLVFCDMVAAVRALAGGRHRHVVHGRVPVRTLHRSPRTTHPATRRGAASGRGVVHGIGAEPGRGQLRGRTTRPVPAGPGASVGIGHRGMPRGQPASQPRAGSRHRAQRAHRARAVRRGVPRRLTTSVAGSR